MTELIWEGKYDKDGHKVAPLRVQLPFQTVETVNESAQERQRTLDLFSSNRPGEWRNRLIWGDKKYVLPALLEEITGQINLIYIDPPFDTGADFSYEVQVNGEGFVKEPSIIEQRAYRDTWGHGIDSYLKWFYETVILLRDLLTPSGCIWVHIGTNIASYVQCIMDEVFGIDNRRNQVVVKRITKNLQRQFSNIYSLPEGHDVLLWYSRNPDVRFAPLLVGQEPQHPQGYWKDFWSGADRPTMRYPIHDVSPTRGQWKWSRDRAMQAVENYENYENISSKTGQSLFDYWDSSERNLSFIRKSLTGKIEHWVPPFDTKFVDTLWLDISAYSFTTGYDTEKSEQLLTRIVTNFSEENDLVLDCFAGSGTTAIVAEKYGRRWITCDLGRFAINTTRKRLLSLPDVKPFIIQNLGKYERQLWQAAEFGEQAEKRMLAYRRFILELYHAQPITGYTWLHGVKAGRMVHVGAVDSPVSPGDVSQIAAEFKRAVGTGEDAPKTNGVDVLGWDFAFELNEVAKQQAAQANINIRFLRIPREVLEKKAVEQGDIRFFELASLSVDVEQKGTTVTLKLTDFIIPPDDVPEDVRLVITNWEQWIDYWAVDWNNRDDTFHNEWQDYRTRKKRELQKTISHTYEQPGTYIIMVKVIDILGNDTTKKLMVEVH